MFENYHADSRTISDKIRGMASPVPLEILAKYANQVRAQKAAGSALVPAQSQRPVKGAARFARAIGPFGVATAGGYSMWPWEQILHYRTICFQCCNFIGEHFANCTPTAVLKASGIEKRKHTMMTKAYFANRGPRPQERRYVSQAMKTKAAGPIESHEEYEHVDDNDPLADLLRKPNWDESGFPFWYMGGVFFAIAGDVYIYKSRDTARRVESLFILPPQWMRPVCDGEGHGNSVIKGYECTPMRGINEWYDAEDIIRIRRPSPFHPLAAASATAMNAAEIDTYDQLSAVQNSSLKNRMQFSGILRAEGGIEPMGQVQLDQFMSFMQDRYGGIYNSGKPLPLEPGWIWENLPEPAALLMGESKEAQRRLIIQGYGLDPSYFESKEHTEAGVNDMRRKIRDTVLNPMLRFFGEQLTERLAIEEFGDNYRIIYPDDLQESHADKLARLEQLSKYNRISTNQHRMEWGMEPVDEPEADIIFVLPNLVPLSMSEEAAENTVNPPQAMGAGQSQGFEGDEYTDTPLDDGGAEATADDSHGWESLV